jgi:hypothetical protein
LSIGFGISGIITEAKIRTEDMAGRYTTNSNIFICTIGIGRVTVVVVISSAVDNNSWCLGYVEFAIDICIEISKVTESIRVIAKTT